MSTLTSRKGKLQELSKPSTLGTVSSNNVPWESHDRLALPLFLMFCAPFYQNSNQGSLPPYHEWALDTSWRKHETIPASWDCPPSPPYLPKTLVYYYPDGQPNDTNALFAAKSFRSIGGLTLPEEFNFYHFRINPGFGPRLTEASRLHVVVTTMRAKCTVKDFRPKLEGTVSVVDRRLRDSNGAEISVPYRVQFRKWLSPEQVETVRRGGNPYRIYSVLAISGWVLLALAPGIVIVSLKLKKRGERLPDLEFFSDLRQSCQMLVAQQIFWFVSVGIFSTAIDFSLYNVFAGRRFRWSRICANLLSTTVAMAFSFTMNLLLVFPPEQFSVIGRALKFVAVTACSLYLLQSVVIYVATNIWKFPVRVAKSIAKQLPYLRNQSEDVISRNTVKLLATGFSLVWNFLWYKFYVFR